MKKNITTFTTNWWANLIPAVAFGLIFLTSCKRDQEFDLAQKSSSSGIGVIYTDTITVETSTILNNDSLVTNRPTRLLFGAYSDVETGVTNAETFFRLYPKVDNVDYTGATVDSAFLYIDYDYAYGDTMQTQTVSAHELTSQIVEDVTYTSNNNTVTIDATEAGNASFAARPNVLNHLIKIELTNTFATDLLNKADDKNSVDFQTAFYGLVLKANGNSGSVISGMPTIMGNITTQTKLVVYYKINGTNASSDFIVYVGAPSYNKFSVDRSATALAGLINKGDEIPSSLTNNQTYIQNGVGLFTKINFPYLNDFSKYKDSAVIINKANLIIYSKSGSINGYPLVPQCQLYELNTNNTFALRNSEYAKVQATGAPQSGVGYDVYSNNLEVINNGKYVFDITSYIQALIYKKITTNGIALYPTNNSSLVNRSVLNSQQSSSTDKIQLQIYYTLLK